MANKKLPDFTMPFSPSTIKHLGVKLYSTLPPVIGELISNAHDAESPKAEIILPKGPISPASEVVVRDYGHGMVPDEIQAHYLPIGRDRRQETGSAFSKNNKVRVTGRKGLGKLSAFGVADVIEIRSVASGFGTCLRLRNDAILSWAKAHPGKPYKPEVVGARTGTTGDPDGVEVRLTGLHRTKPIDEAVIRRGLARRLSFIGADFQVLVNGNPIGPGDRFQKSSCIPDQCWDLANTGPGAEIEEGIQVSGWIGFLAKASTAERGIDIFASGKAVELASFFGYSSTHAQYARAHVVGEVFADFLDADEDLVATARNEVMWESQFGEALKSWGQDLLRWAFGEWLRLRKKRKETEATKLAGFDLWLKGRTTTEQRIANRMVKLLVEDDKLELESMAPLLEIVKSSVETKAFHEMVDLIEQEGSSASVLLSLFDEWRIIEAREMLKLADGRRAAIGRLREFMDEDALEVQEVQPLFERNPWLLDQTWTEVDVQQTYTKLLREKCTEPAKTPDGDRRIDILGVSRSEILTVVEIKKPKKTVSRKDLEQIEHYVDWARSNIVGGSNGVAYAHGLLIVGKMSSLDDVHSKMERLAGDDIRVKSYMDLHNAAYDFYAKLDEKLKQIAPEYVKKTQGEG